MFKTLWAVAIISLVILREGFCLPSQIVIGRAGDSQDTLIAYKILEIAYSNLGVKAIDTPMPALRSLIELEKGRIDAEAQRIDQLKNEYKNIIQVPIRINYIVAAAFSWKKDIKIRTWNDLKSYKVGIVKGIRFADIGTKQHPERSFFTDYSSLFRSLSKKRIDVAIAPKMNGFIEIRQLNLQNSIHLVSKNLQIIPLFHYLSVKREELYEPIYAVLKEMRDNGQLEKIRRDVLVTHYKMPDAYFDE